MNKAVFLDRDGVLIEDMDYLTSEDQIHLYSYVPQALENLIQLGYKLIVISNQTVVARGSIDEQEVIRLHNIILEKIQKVNGVRLDGFYFCPHHPNATVEKYRSVCPCRKPEPGMLLSAAKKYHIDLHASFMVGDRITDCIAGSKAGCRSILVKTGKHTEPPIETASPISISYKPDFECMSLLDASTLIKELS